MKDMQQVTLKNGREARQGTYARLWDDDHGDGRGAGDEGVGVARPDAVAESDSIRLRVPEAGTTRWASPRA